MCYHSSAEEECNKKMKELEKQVENEKKERWKNNPSNEALTLAQSAKAWMETFKSATLKGKSYDTFESTYTNQIMTAPFAKFQVVAVTDIDIQSYLSELGKRGYSISTIRKTYSFFNQFFGYIFRIRPYDNPMMTVRMPRRQNNISLDEDGNIENYDEVWGMENSQYEVLDDDEIVRFIYAATVPRIQGVQGYNDGICFAIETEQFREIIKLSIDENGYYFKHVEGSLISMHLRKKIYDLAEFFQDNPSYSVNPKM